MLLFIHIFLLYMMNISSTYGILQDIYWRDYVFGDIPCDAYEAAPGRYIGQINYNGYNLPATIYTSSGEAVSTLSGKRSTKFEIKILCSPDHEKIYWDYVDFTKSQDLQLQYAIKGGFQNIERNQLYIGKTMHEEEWKIGKVRDYAQPKDRGLFIWSNCDENVNIRKFYILKYNITASCRKQEGRQCTTKG